MKVSLLERADYADHSLLSGASLRNQRFPATNYDINEAFSYERTDKICGICGSLTPYESLGKMWVHGSLKGGDLEEPYTSLTKTWKPEFPVSEYYLQANLPHRNFAAFRTKIQHGNR